MDVAIHRMRDGRAECPHGGFAWCAACGNLPTDLVRPPGAPERVIAFVAFVLAVVVAACGGREAEPYCEPAMHFCEGQGYCCANGSTCGTDVNGCAKGFCCPDR